MSIFDLAPIPGVTLIGFGHKSRHGKDVSVGAIQAYAPYDVQRFAFADQLKAFARVSGGMTTKDGHVLQALGQSMRDRDSDLWERVLYWTIDEQRPLYALVSDVRYIQEAEFIKHLGGKLVKVYRTNPDGTQFVNPLRAADHPSETQLDNYQGWDYVLNNASSISDLRMQAVDLFIHIVRDSNGTQKYRFGYKGTWGHEAGPKDNQRLPVVLGGSLQDEARPPGLAGEG